MQLNSIFCLSVALVDQHILTCSMTKFTGDNPKTFNKHNMFPTYVPLKAAENHTYKYLQDQDLKL